MTPPRLSRAEIGKDAVQEGIEATATTVGAVATIITGAIRDVTRAVGGLGTELFEIREAARRAGRDRAEEDGETGLGAGAGSEGGLADGAEGPDALGSGRSVSPEHAPG